MVDLSKLTTEQRNPLTLELDTFSPLEIAQAMNAEDANAVKAVECVLPQVAQAIQWAASCLADGGRIIYLGAGTSGRLGVLDAVECPPTFGVDNDLVVGLIAGGEDAFVKAREGAEDDTSQGEGDLRAIDLCERDFVVGLAASGRTPYVIGGLTYARELGCKTAAVACVPTSRIGEVAELAIEPVTGPEVLTGSTRLKAGTAQKLVLNMISTGAMTLTGKVYQNLMVDVKQTNQKLHARARNIVIELRLHARGGSCRPRGGERQRQARRHEHPAQPARRSGGRSTFRLERPCSPGTRRALRMLAERDRKLTSLPRPASSRALLWGGATASSQYEGAFAAGGKGLDTQDVRPYLPRTSDATTATRLLTRSAVERAKTDTRGAYPFRTASDGYHHLEEDIALLQELGIDIYRFSISWARLFPMGDEPEPNPEGLAYYDRVFSAVRKAGTKVFLTLTHYALPLHLVEAYGAGPTERSSTCTRASPAWYSSAGATPSIITCRSTRSTRAT